MTQWLGVLRRKVEREPGLASLGFLGALSVAAMPVYLWVRQYRHVLGIEPGSEGAFIWDFSYYYEAAGRFLQSPMTLYADPEFFYPPPSVLAFLPWLVLPLPAAYLLSQAVILAATALGLLLALRLWQEAYAETLPGGTKTLLVLTGLGTAPVFQSMKFGQIGPLLLLIGVGAVLLLQRGRPMAAALVITGGFWLKLYPILLVPLGLRGRPMRFGAGLVVGGVVVPLLLLAVIPLELYEMYFFEHLPARSDLTSTFALNESLAGVLTRLGEPLAAFQHRADARIPPVASALVLGATLLGVGGLVGLWLRQRLTTAAAGVSLLALVPVVSPLGWEHLYVLALPLVLFALLVARPARPWVRGAVGLAALVFFVPMLPQALMFASFEWWPRPVHDVLSARHLLATLGLLAVVVTRDGTHAPRQPEPPGRAEPGAVRGVSR